MKIINTDDLDAAARILHAQRVRLAVREPAERAPAGAPPPLVTPLRSTRVHSRRPRNPAAWSSRAVAERWGIGRDKLRVLTSAGLVKVIAWGRGVRIPASEVERVEREGLPALPAEPVRRGPPRRRKGAPGPGVGESIRRLPFGRRAKQ